MSEHISFDEMQGFVFADSLTPDVIRLGARINSHIIACEECSVQYETLLALREETQAVAAAQQRTRDDARNLIEKQMSGGDQQEEREQGMSNGPGRGQTVQR